FLLDALVLDLAKLGFGDLELLGDLVHGIGHGHQVAILESDQAVEDFLPLRNRQAFGTHGGTPIETTTATAGKGASRALPRNKALESAGITRQTGQGRR